MNSSPVPISVVIPTFNRVKLLKRAVDSVLGQTVQAAEVIVVDDGSTDETPAVCRQFDSRVKVVRQANAGASMARNAGVQQATQPWIAFLDSDDYWTPAHLANIVQAIEATKGAARFYFSDMEFPREEGGGTLWGKINFKFSGNHLMTPDATPWMLLKRQPTMLQCSVFNRRALDECGGLQPKFKLMHDSDLFLRAGIGGPACAVAGVGCIQTADDHSGNRLTGVVSEDTERYCIEQRELWHNVVSMAERMKPEQSRLARANLGLALWRLSRLNAKSGNYGSALLHCLRLGFANPALLWWIVCHRRSDGFEAHVRSDGNVVQA
jgi:glycosyltransferase involved in cell wall biosynthesis